MQPTFLTLDQEPALADQIHTASSVGTFQAFGESRNYVVSAGAHYLIDFGIGFTFKDVTESLGFSGKGTVHARDFGLLARVPVIELVESLGKRSVSIADRWHPFVDLSVGVAWNNRGDEIVFSDVDQSDPLPAYRRAGWASEVGVSWKGDSLEWDLFKFTIAYEEYTPQIRGVEEPGTSDDMRGFEFSFFDIFDVRRGKYDDEDGRRHTKAEGYTLRSDGLFKLVRVFARQRSQNSRWLDVLSNHLSFSWTRFEKRGGSVFAGTNHTEIMILF